MNPILSIIIPMRPGVESSWLNQILRVQGRVEVITVYPPHTPFVDVTDNRLHQISSAIKGEVFQRITALLNAKGKYVLSINCDEYIHPDIVKISEEYFTHYPDSYFFRLNQVFFPYGELPVSKPWKPLRSFDEIKVKSRMDLKELSQAESQYEMMREIPIPPLEHKLDLWALVRGSKEHCGPHQENFDKKVWKNELVQVALEGITPTFTVLGPLKYIPFWTADRLIGLSVQAHFFERDRIVGHWLPLPEQLRTENNPPDFSRGAGAIERRYILAELLLLKQFPQYGYFWNFVVLDSRLGIFTLLIPKMTLKKIKFFLEKLFRRKENT